MRPQKLSIVDLNAEVCKIEELMSLNRYCWQQTKNRESS